MGKNRHRHIFLFNDIWFAIFFIFFFIVFKSHGISLFDSLIIILIAAIIIIGLFVIGTGAIATRVFEDNYLRAFSWFAIQISFIITAFSIIYSKYGLVDPNGNIAKDIYTSFYFSIVTFTTLGFGDFRPTPSVRLFSALEALLGYLSLGILLFILLKAIAGKKPDKSDKLPQGAAADE